MNKRGQIVNMQHSGGMTVAQAWASIFVANEKNWRRAETRRLILPDDLITERMYFLFPDRRDSEIFKEPNRVRNRYNRGALSGVLAPAKPSCRYQRNGAGVTRHPPRTRRKSESGI